MNKLFIFSLCILLSFSLVSAFSFDNVKSYDKAQKKITIKNGFGLGGTLAEYTLNYNTDSCLVNCYANGTFSITKQDKMLDNIKFKQLNNKLTSINNRVQIREVGNTDWINYEGGLTKKGNYEWQLFGNKKANDSIDWIFNTQGVDLDEWAWWSTNWTNKINGTILGHKIGDNLTNFTVLLALNQTILDFNKLNGDCSDIRVLNGSENEEFSYEIEFCNSTNAYVWAKIPSLVANTNYTFWIYYRNPLASNNSNRINTWHSDTIVAYHFAENPNGTLGNIKDSSRMSNNATSQNMSGSQTDVLIGKGLLFNESGIVNSSVNISIVSSGNRTLSFWTKKNQGNGASIVSIGRGVANGMFNPNLVNESANLSLVMFGGGQDWDNISVLGNSTLQHHFITYNGSKIEWFIDMKRVDGGMIKTTNTLDNILQLGQRIDGVGDKYNGTLDELRIYNNSFSQAWGNATYFSERQQLITYGSAQSTDLGFAISLIAPLNGERIFSPNILFNATITPQSVSGTNTTNATIYVYYSNGSLFNKTTNIVTGNALNSTTWNISNILISSYNWSVQACGINNSASGCETSTNRTFTTIPIFGLCNSSNNVVFANYTFQDENTTALNGRFDSSTWTIFKTRSINQSITFSNTTANPSYAFCFSPAQETITLDYLIQYSNANYPQRRYEKIGQSLTNSTTNTILYMLHSNDGIYSSISAIDSLNTPIQGVTITAERVIGSNYELIETSATDSSGLVTFWVNPNFDHRITASKTGYGTVVVTIRPTQALYTITMSTSGSNASYIDNLKGMKWVFYPQTGFIDTGANKLFGFNITTSKANIVSCRFDLLNLTFGTLNTTTGCNANGGNLSLRLTTTSGQKILGRAYIDIGNGLMQIDSDAFWIAYKTNITSNLTLHGAFKDLLNYSEFGGHDKVQQEYSRIVFFFLLLTILLGIITFTTKYDFAYPGAAILLMWPIVLFASYAGFFEFEGLVKLNGLGPLGESAARWFSRHAVAIIISFFAGGYLLNYWRRASQ